MWTEGVGLLVVLFGLAAGFCGSFYGPFVELARLLRRDNANSCITVSIIVAALFVGTLRLPSVRNASLEAEKPGRFEALLSELYSAPKPVEKVVLIKAEEPSDFRSTEAPPTQLERKPILRTLSEIRNLIRRNQFDDALAAYSQMVRDRGVIGERHKAGLENIALTTIRPLPASDRLGNLDGYEFLLTLRPDNRLYRSKIKQYR